MPQTKWPNNLPRPGNRKYRKTKGKSGWFEIYKINDDTYAFLEPNHWEEVISYLIIGKDKALLFDSGMGIGDIRSEVTSLTKLPIVVINSHSHYDHIGGNHQFEEIWCYNHEFEYSRIEKGYTVRECHSYMTPNSYINLPKNINPATFFVSGTRVSRLLNNLDEIDIGGRSLTVYSTPGETPGAISLHDRNYGLLFCGDLIYPGMLWLYQEESSWEKFLQSLDQVLEIISEVKFICPAHNEVCLPNSFFHELYAAVQMIAKGKSTGSIKDGKMLYEFEKFSIALAEDQ